jgi:hypothetical protein
LGRIDEGVRLLIRNPIYELGNEKSNPAKWGRKGHLSPPFRHQFLIPFIAMDENSSLAAKI